MFKTSDYVWNVCSGRYAEFAIHLNSQGYGVFGMDWIGILDTQHFTLLNSCFNVSYCLVYTLNHEFGVVFVKKLAYSFWADSGSPFLFSCLVCWNVESFHDRLIIMGRTWRE